VYGGYKSANINWVKDIYLEQEFDVVNDSVFYSRDYLMSDFAVNKKKEFMENELLLRQS
jgi:hypothetical protein